MSEMEHDARAGNEIFERPSLGRVVDNDEVWLKRIITIIDLDGVVTYGGHFSWHQIIVAAGISSRTGVPCCTPQGQIEGRMIVTLDGIGSP